MGWLGEKSEGERVGLIPLLNTQFLCMSSKVLEDGIRNFSGAFLIAAGKCFSYRLKQNTKRRNIN